MPENEDPNHKSLTIHSYNLENLVQWVHQQLMVGSQHIGFVEDEISDMPKGKAAIVSNVQRGLDQSRSPLRL